MVANANRCECNTPKGRRCKKAVSFVCDKTNCCTIHAYPYSLYALTIQKAYKGYHSRKYVRLLTKLPCDIQKNIVFYIREPVYNARRNKSIQAILSKRFVTIFGTPKSIWFGFIETNVNAFLGDYKSSVLIMNKRQFNDHILDITHLHKLYIKYMTICDTEYNNMLYHITNIVKKHIEECLYFYHHSGEPYLYSNEEMLVLHKNVFELQKCIGIYKFEYRQNLHMRRDLHMRNLQNNSSI
jgi:hypothetical protein